MEMSVVHNLKKNTASNVGFGEPAGNTPCVNSQVALLLGCRIEIVLALPPPVLVPFIVIDNITMLIVWQESYLETPSACLVGNTRDGQNGRRHAEAGATKTTESSSDGRSEPSSAQSDEL